MKSKVVSGSPELVYELETQDLKAFFRKPDLEFKTPVLKTTYLNLVIKINRSDSSPRSHVKSDYISSNI